MHLCLIEYLNTSCLKSGTYRIYFDLMIKQNAKYELIFLQGWINVLLKELLDWTYYYILIKPIYNFTFSKLLSQETSFSLMRYLQNIVSIEDPACMASISVFTDCTLHLTEKSRKTCVLPFMCFLILGTRFLSDSIFDNTKL